jgi:hypothetical protein
MFERQWLICEIHAIGMGRAITVIVCSLFLFILAQAMYASADSSVGAQNSSNYSEVYGLEGSHFLFWNGTGIHLVDVANNIVLDSQTCGSPGPRISANRSFIICNEAIYEYTGSNLSIRYLNPSNLLVNPESNLSVIWYSPQWNNANGWPANQQGWINIMNGSTVHRNISAISYDDRADLMRAILMEDSTEIMLLYSKKGEYYIYIIDYNQPPNEIFPFRGSSATNICGWGFTCNPNSIGEIEYGAFEVTATRGNCGGNCGVTTYALIASGATMWASSGDDYTTTFTSPDCSIKAWDSGGVSGHSIDLGYDIEIPKAPKEIACNSLSNATVLTDDGTWFTVWNDEDGDGDNDLQDQFPLDSSQWDDLDSDGYGDNPLGNFSDDCISNPGTSSIISLGCPDSDGDHYADKDEAFPSDATQWNDTDYDGYGDNLGGTRGDNCPTEYGTSTRNNTLGCPDRDFDGWADNQDVFVNESSQWSDSDGDGYGDELIGFQGDACPTTLGNSTEDKFGCPDTDGDGWSDDGDDLPTEPTQWTDRDGDGYGDNTTGTEGDWFPEDSTRWQDTDRDGVADEDDEFINDATQWNDTDGDGYGDEANGNRADAFPNDPAEWMDSDADGLGNNADDFPFDPTQKVDSDGDGMGDNPMGIGADKFPNDPSQWGDIDGDGYGDNASGNNSDAFITDPTQWSDADGDGYGDNPSGRLYDLFPDNPTQWEDADDDGLGDNPNGTDADPYLNDYDNDGYNDSVDILPKLASPGDLDNDGCLDEVDVFPADYKECLDFDGDGEGDNADTDDDNDGWADTDEMRRGTDPFSSAETPVDSFEMVVPGTAIGLGAWDLMGIFGGVPLFSWLAFGFATRNARCGRFEEKLNATTNLSELEGVALQWEYALMMRLLGPHQGIRLERLRADLEDGFAAQEVAAIPMGFDQTAYVMAEDTAKNLPDLQTTQPPPPQMAGIADEAGYEWLDADGAKWHRVTGSGSEWTKWE